MDSNRRFIDSEGARQIMMAQVDEIVATFRQNIDSHLQAVYAEQIENLAQANGEEPDGVILEESLHVIVEFLPPPVMPEEPECPGCPACTIIHHIPPDSDLSSDYVMVSDSDEESDTTADGDEEQRVTPPPVMPEEPECPGCPIIHFMFPDSDLSSDCIMISDSDEESDTAADGDEELRVTPPPVMPEEPECPGCPNIHYIPPNSDLSSDYIMISDSDEESDSSVYIVEKSDTSVYTVEESDTADDSDEELDRDYFEKSFIPVDSFEELFTAIGSEEESEDTWSNDTSTCTTIVSFNPEDYEHSTDSETFMKSAHEK